MLLARQMGQEVRDAPFSENQQRRSRRDGGLEEDGVTEIALVSIVAGELLARVARERRRKYRGQQL